MHPGFLSAVAQAVFGKFGGSVRHDAERATVTLSIPKSHPKADQLTKLAAELAHYRELESGLQISRPYVPGSEERLREVLKDIVDDLAGAGAFEGLMADLDRRQTEIDAKAELQAVMGELATPAGLGKVVEECFKHQALGPNMAHHDAVRLLNKAEAQARTGQKILDHAGG